jgi:hypothetical protein
MMAFRFAFKSGKGKFPVKAAMAHTTGPRPIPHSASHSRKENAQVRTAEAAAFYKQLNFTSVHTLSPHDPALLALARLPIAVAFHSVIGQKHDRADSDGVVRYASSHLEGARSELLVRSGHNAFDNPGAQSEVVRILREEVQHSGVGKRPRATMLGDYAEERNRVFHNRSLSREEF